MFRATGTSLWTLTHHRDFAKGFGGVLGENRATARRFTSLPMNG
ncbi:MAG: hypothetical protein R3C26_17405 [Calditrichia bacterium]